MGQDQENEEEQEDEKKDQEGEEEEEEKQGDEKMIQEEEQEDEKEDQYDLLTLLTTSLTMVHPLLRGEIEPLRNIKAFSRFSSKLDLFPFAIFEIMPNCSNQCHDFDFDTLTPPSVGRQRASVGSRGPLQT